MPDLLCAGHMINVFALADKVFSDDTENTVEIVELVIQKRSFDKIYFNNHLQMVSDLLECSYIHMSAVADSGVLCEIQDDGKRRI